MQFFKRILKDIKNRRNIEVYVVSFAAVLVAVASLFGDAVMASLGDNIVNSIILTALSILVLNISIPKSDKSTLDDYLDDRTNLGSFKDRIHSAHKLYIYAPSAANILRGESADAIREQILSRKDGELRMIIQNPDNQPAVDILEDQLDKHVNFQMQHLPDELTRTLRQFQLIHEWDLPGSFEYRLLDYSPGFSMVMIDPDSNKGQIIVEVHGYQNESTSGRMHIVITKKDSERWFVYWQRQFDNMWERGQAGQFPVI